MDSIQKALIKAGRKDLAQKYYLKRKKAGINKSVSTFNTYITSINWNIFLASDMMQEDFGACLVNFYADYFTDLDRTDFKIKQNIDAILKNIKKGAKDQIKRLIK